MGINYKNKNDKYFVKDANGNLIKKSSELENLINNRPSFLYSWNKGTTRVSEVRKPPIGMAIINNDVASLKGGTAQNKVSVHQRGAVEKIPCTSRPSPKKTQE